MKSVVLAMKTTSQQRPRNWTYRQYVLGLNQLTSVIDCELKKKSICGSSAASTNSPAVSACCKLTIDQVQGGRIFGGGCNVPNAYNSSS